jgi:hypothetical protein
MVGNLGIMVGNLEHLVGNLGESGWKLGFFAFFYTHFNAL